ncbi:hypothetical protein [Methanosphaera sp. WGK6]|uniref:hypothetical protein n=1 Tax=Methanosphaera sp. WGK6 TaxID=1561964 RepID=UPI00084C5B52|nr:hypothetical protein [Methanosphaera sp. WGK6]OED29906.1 hypothetical protein NL43_05710 [Methanosphaera sp. WGK6]
MNFNNKEKIINLLNINNDEFKYITDLNKRNLVFEAMIKDKIDEEIIENKCILILQKSTLKIIKFSLDENNWTGNTLIYYKSIDLINTLIVNDTNYATIHVASMKLLLEFKDKEVMHEFYKELTYKTNTLKERKFI